MPAIKGDMYINAHCNYSQPTLIKLDNENIGGHLTPLQCHTKKTSEISTIALQPEVDRHLKIDFPAYSSQEPTQRRLEENPFVAIDPRPDPAELSHAPTSQVPRIHDSCHNTNRKAYLLHASFALKDCRCR